MSTNNRIKHSFESDGPDDSDEEGEAFDNAGMTLKVEQRDAYKYLNHSLESDDADAEGGTEDGGVGAAGSITFSVEQLNAYLLACFMALARKGEQQFGPVPFTDDPNSLLGANKGQAGSYYADQPHAHPLLMASQQFSGDDPKLTAIPAGNSKVTDRLNQLRAENQLRKNQRLGLGRSKTVTLER